MQIDNVSKAMGTDELRRQAMEVRNLHFSYGKNKVLDGISFFVEEGLITTIMGANGCGKSTLFGLMTRNLTPDSGKIFLRGKNIQNLSLKEYARQVAIVNQYNTAAGDTRVEQLVSYGRTPFHRIMEDNDRKDDELIDWAMNVTNVAQYRDREIGSLSGGQRQRVWIAMALAQNTRVLFLDEPTTYLDIRYQVEILELIRKLNREYRLTIVMVLHDINQAIYYSDRIIGLESGKVLMQGDPEEMISEKSIKDLYGVQLEVTLAGGRKFVIPSGVNEGSDIYDIGGEYASVSNQAEDISDIYGDSTLEEESMADEKHNTAKRSNSKAGRAVWIVLGLICFGLGTVGVALPILPTVPFYLAALFCFAKGSEKLYNWFINTELYHKHLESFTDHKAMTWGTKIRIVGSVTAVMALGFFMMKNVPVGRVILAVVWAAHLIVFFFVIKTEPTDKEDVEES